MLALPRVHARRLCWHDLAMRSTRLVGLIIVSFTTLGTAACSSSATSTLINPTAERGVQIFTGLARNHVDTPVSYPQSPPVGGDHSAVWQNCGIYNTPVKNENAVHSLEHGAVWLAYRPDLSADEIETIRALARTHTHVLVTPYEGLKEPVVATAWGTQLRLDSVTDARLARFVATYEEGPQTPEPGATCSGALGKPIE